jgi:hypothetical protein
MDKWFKVILPDKDPYHNRGRDQMRKKGGPEFECLWVLPNLGRSPIKNLNNMRQVLPVVPAKYNPHYLITVVWILVINRARIRKKSENLDVGVILYISSSDNKSVSHWIMFDYFFHVWKVNIFFFLIMFLIYSCSHV